MQERAEQLQEQITMHREVMGLKEQVMAALPRHPPTHKKNVTPSPRADTVCLTTAFLVGRRSPVQSIQKV